MKELIENCIRLSVYGSPHYFKACTLAKMFMFKIIQRLCSALFRLRRETSFVSLTYASTLIITNKCNSISGTIIVLHALRMICTSFSMAIMSWRRLFLS